MLTVQGLLAQHLADVDERIAAGRLSPRTRCDYTYVRRFFKRAGLLHVPVDSLGPGCFTALQRCLEMAGISLRSQKDVVASTRAVFHWAEAMELVDRPIRYGPRFVPPSSIAIAAERERRGATRFIDAEAIRSALAGADLRMRVFILLGINCAFYPSDTAEITQAHFHLDGAIPYHDFRRVKTYAKRLAVLWPVTAEAINGYICSREKPEDPGERRLILAGNGRALSSLYSTAKLGRAFNALLPNGRRPRGASLGSLRHTYATVVDQFPDQAIIDLTMGHSPRGLQKQVYRQFNLHELERLKALSELVRGWLFHSD